MIYINIFTFSLVFIISYPVVLSALVSLRPLFHLEYMPLSFERFHGLALCTCKKFALNKNTTISSAIVSRFQVPPEVKA